MSAAARLDIPSAPRSAGLPSAVALGASRTGIELRQFFRERDAVVFIFAFPVIMLGIFSVVFGRTGSVGDVPFSQYFLPGMIAAGVLVTSFQSLAVTIAMERDDGTLKRLRGTPMPPVAYFLGKVGLVLVTGSTQVAILLAYAALVFDVALPGPGRAWLTFAWVFALGSAAGTVLGIGFSSVPRSGRSASAVVTSVVLVLQFTSGVFFVFAQLPGWMQTVASVFPLKWMAQGMRSVFLPAEAELLEASGSWQHGETALILAVWLVVGLALTVRGFRWTRRDAG
jgi:ABC-2 type transport system permease protein